ncbi:hypothetical protein C2S52_023664 [Perilla frutescens var. hirtella]|nr:hypothetical protein C2S52_023664 [Perilla frutescens var. hirtella]KAH6764199.1 hypothetical protein C2S51_015448 [Perilla frutescens var. frutescens]
MAQKLEAIKGGGGSIKVGTTGTISALMSRELESASKVSSTCKPVASIGGATPRRLRPGTDEASSSSDHLDLRRKHRCGGTPQIPGASAISVNGTPTRKKAAKKGHGLVEIVDTKCGDPDRTWINPITHRLKKLGFSKLSDSNV